MAACLQTAAAPQASATEQAEIPRDALGRKQRRCKPLTMTRMWAQVAEARSDETFVALCLLTVTGASLLTQKLGFSDTMGAFVAGVLLAETNYSTQVQPPCIIRRRSLTAGFILNQLGFSISNLSRSSTPTDVVVCLQPKPQLLAYS